ncbi:hypothetical protein [Streptomyces sp. NPDC056682]|uniref:hypothetical protein n=1 Tax=Streptomyces sp. NPDC056682 TaxID=3345909 RepID=UPI0036A20D5F
MSVLVTAAHVFGWADEEAGTLVGLRPLVARTVARAALAAKRAPRHSLAATGGPVPQRVRALLAPPTPTAPRSALREGELRLSPAAYYRPSPPSTSHR